MELLVQQYLRTHTFKELQTEHGVYASFSNDGRLFSLNYDQLEVKDDDELSQECRGLILSIKDGRSLNELKDNIDCVVPGETIIQSFPFRRFFNYGQSCAANINWNDPGLLVLVKMDGTLCEIFHDKINNEWKVATRSVPEANVPLTSDKKLTFRKLFEKGLFNTCKLSFDEFTYKLNKDYTYMFELTGPFNRIVVDYRDTAITLLGARDLNNLQEIRLSDLDIGVPKVKAFDISKLSDLIDWVSAQDPLEYEGAVVCDSNFNRIKVKNPAYVIAHKAVSSCLSERNCLELILLGKDDDVIKVLPDEIVQNILKIKEGLRIIINQHDIAYIKHKDDTDKLDGSKKTFAKLVLDDKSIWSAPLFSFYDKRSKSMLDFINQNKKNECWGDNFLDKLLDLTKLNDILES